MNFSISSPTVVDWAYDICIIAGFPLFEYVTLVPVVLHLTLNTTVVFVGLESGDQQVLDLVNKGVTVEQQIEAVVQANSAGLQTSVTVILGLGGRKLSLQHAVNTGLAVSAMNPTLSLP